MAGRKQPNPIDIHVGSRLKLRRTMMGMTQEKLGDSLGVTFQQVQKYEKGTNRIGASRLQEISEILEAPVSFFFEDASPLALNKAEPRESAGFADDGAPGFLLPGETTGEALELAKAFSRIRDPRVRRRVIDLVETLADARG
ncbi:helix-turn-helix transcriptional regulator [Acuticoccus sp. MNP-M23]|uniref:helix-turn-helix domain-containing protein n=1 Tax=Acuticoccus sp. MNP-M23 TaxID=3072793 RepID=UPI0028152995|nr:helix-turn-helix transcriptional regulator [Acuticoccus sp. MNP-M23]WMS43377.1 helix-turn-helix transcriptional regulator [Acuticoccus sp. MNP-M23]